MKPISLLAVVVTVGCFVGCSSKKYFEPEVTYSASSATKSYGGHMGDLSRSGGTLVSGAYLGKEGLSRLNLGKGYRFLNESQQYVLASNAEGKLKVIDKKSQKSLQTIDMKVPVVAASIHNGYIGYLLNSNTFGIYKMATKKKILESQSEKTFAIDTRAANPLFVDNILVMPMLDGKLIILNTADTQSAKMLYLSSEKNFNNVIYLARSLNTLIAATPTRLLTLGSSGQNTYRAHISEVAVLGKAIYLFTKEGEIIKLNHALKELKKEKFKFAHFAVATAFDGKVFALDQKGSLIVTSADLNKSKIYKLGSISEPVIISGTKLYKEGDVIDLTQLGYE